MQVVSNKDFIQAITHPKKEVYLWGCSELTKKLLSQNKLEIQGVQGIIDTNPSNVKDPFFINFSLYEATILDHLDDAILLVHGNHCKAVFEQLKSMPLSPTLEIFFDYENGAQKIFNRDLYINTTYDLIQNSHFASTKIELTTIEEQNFTNNGGDILIHLEEAKKIFSTEQLSKAHIDFLNTFINNSKIYIGCGEDYRQGYLHCDKRDLSHVDIVCNAWEIDTKIQNLSTIYSRHMLEHLTNKEAELTLQNWYKALQTDGYVEIIVPNFDLRAQQWLSCEWELDTPTTQDEIWAVAGCWGWQRECDPLQENYNQSYWDVHKSGYNEKRITKILSHIGFKEIKTNVDAKNNLIAIAYKR